MCLFVCLHFLNSEEKLDFFDRFLRDIYISVRMELHGLQERLSSLKAGLRTWLDHLNRLKTRVADYEAQTADIATVIAAAQDHVDQPYPPELAVNVENDLQISQVVLSYIRK